MERKFQTGALDHVATATRNKSAEFVWETRRAWTVIFFMTPRATQDGPVQTLFGKNPRWSRRTTFHKRVQQHTAGAGVQFFRAVPRIPPPCLCPSCWAGCFQTQWIHLSGQAQCERSSPKRSQSQSRIKRMKRRRVGGERMTNVWSQRMLKLAKFDSQKNQPLIEMCVRIKCPVHSTTTWFYPCWTTWGSPTHVNDSR